jgi:hypothetical protein
MAFMPGNFSELGCGRKPRPVALDALQLVRKRQDS